MPIIGFLVAVIGLIGLILNATGIYQMEGALSDLRLWGGMAAAGAVVYFFTRRARD